MRYLFILFFLLFSSNAYSAQQGNTTGVGTWDLGSAKLEIPNSTTLPVTCTVGQIYMDTDATSGQRIYACQSTDTWALQGDGGAGGGAPTTVDYLVGTADGTLSAEIVVGTSPGGELGGTWGSPTLDDSVTVTGWELGASTASTSITSPIHSSNNADPADAGIIRLGNAELIGWEASPAGTDETLTVSTAENFQISGPIEIDATDPADAEAIRLDNAEGIAWEASPAGTDVTLKVDASEILQVSGALNAGGAITGSNLSGTNTGDNDEVGTKTSGNLCTADGSAVQCTTTPATGILTWLATPSSANLRSALTDESGTGVAVFAAGDIGAGTATTPSADDNDTSVATTAYVQTELNAAGGRSLSCASGSCDADVELYTRTICYRLKGPLATDDDKSIWINDSANQFTVTKLWCESDQTVNTMFQVDDGTPADMDTVDLACITTPDTDTSLDGDATIAAGDRVDLDIASVSGSPTWVTVCFTGTYDD